MITTPSRKTRTIHLWPLMLSFFVMGTNLLERVIFRHRGGGDEGSVINQVFLSLAYVMAFFFLLRRRSLFWKMIRQALPWVLSFFLIGLSMAWSRFPQAVWMSVAHQLGAALVAMCSAILWHEDRDLFFKMLFRMGMVYILITILAFAFLPSISLMPERVYSPTRQWRGLTSHYNTLGFFCLTINWIAVASYFLTEKGKKRRRAILCLLMLVLDFYCLYRTNSMTSTLLSIALAFATVWFMFTRTTYGHIKRVKIAFFLLMVSLMIAGVYLVNQKIFTKKYFFKTIGRTETLTNRTTLWELGLKGISIHPYVGWSFDGLRSFNERSGMSYGQVHNGYYDLVLRGGFLAGFLFFLMLLKMIKALRRSKIPDYTSYYFCMMLLIVILAHNITEASFFRNCHFLWQIFLVLYFYALLIQDDRPQAVHRVLPRSSGEKP